MSRTHGAREARLGRTVRAMPSRTRPRAISPRSTAEIVACRACPRLVAWREEVARDEAGRVPRRDVLGPAGAGVRRPRGPRLLVGLAPAAHGGNRTGRVFTGDRSGDWLYARCTAPGSRTSRRRRRADDGLALRDAYVAAAVRCAPPANKPTPDERDRCLPVPRARARAAGPRPRDRRARRVRVRALWAACARPGVAAAPAAPEVRARRSRSDASASTVAGLLPPEPAEHVHRPAHRADARRGVRRAPASSALDERDDLPDAVDRPRSCRVTIADESRSPRSHDRIARCAPTRAPGINADAQREREGPVDVAEQRVGDRPGDREDRRRTRASSRPPL